LTWNNGAKAAEKGVQRATSTARSHSTTWLKKVSRVPTHAASMVTSSSRWEAVCGNRTHVNAFLSSATMIVSLIFRPLRRFLVRRRNGQSLKVGIMIGYGTVETLVMKTLALTL